jgi:hypothetical protein
MKAMKRIYLAVLLLTATSLAWGEWDLVTSDEDDGSFFYVDTTTIRRSGNVVKMWGLLSFKHKQIPKRGKPYMSMMALGEYDCRNEHQRIAYLVSYSEVMGGGKVVSSTNPNAEWSPVVPNSNGTPLWEIACRKQ